MEEGSARVGVEKKSEEKTVPLKAGSKQDLILKSVTETLIDKGFVIAKYGQACKLGPNRISLADDVWTCLLCG